MATIDTLSSRTVPDDIARAVVLPASYGDLEGIVYPACKWLRDNAPVARAEVDGYDPVWLISRHEDLTRVLRDRETFHNADVNIMLQPRAGDEYLRKVLGGHTKVLDGTVNYMDPPQHPQVREAFHHMFLPAQVRKFEPLVREIAKASVDSLFAQEGECDFVEVVSKRYPLNAVLGVLGLPEEHYDTMLKLTQDTFGGDDPDWRRDDVPESPEAMAMGWHAAVEDAYDYGETIRKARLATPTDDLATSIVHAKLPNGQPVSERIQNHMILTVALAGHDTTNSAISAGIYGLALHPDQLEKVHADPSLIQGLVDESLRWASPAKHYMRNAVADAEVGGVHIEAGDRLMCLLVSGNRDERTFEHAEDFDVTRRPNPHLAFSFGPHTCLGQNTAKLEMRVLFEELIPRLGSLELAAKPRQKVSNFVSGLKALPIRFTEA